MTIRVLVADDSARIRRQIRRILELDASIDVGAEATDGVEAVQKARECSPDLAVLDFLMAGMSGLEQRKK
jgi:two-component system chemotaxis response regulator CheB